MRFAFSIVRRALRSAGRVGGTPSRAECRDSFYERLELDIGEQEHGWGNYFPGVIRTLRATSESVPDEEAEAKK